MMGFTIVEITGNACLDCKRCWSTRPHANGRTPEEQKISCSVCHRRTQEKATISAIKCDKCDTIWSPAKKMVGKRIIRCRGCNNIYPLEKTHVRAFTTGYSPTLKKRITFHQLEI